MSSDPNRLCVYEIDSSHDEIIRWNNFVTTNKGTYCHRYEWRDVLRTAYKLRTHYLVIAQAGIWVGILPVAVSPGIGSRKAISLPFCNYGGLLVGGAVDKKLVRVATLDFLQGIGLRHLEVREFGRAGERPTSSEVTMILPLPAQAELLWKSIGQRARNKIRKAERSGLEVRWGREQIMDLYEVYTQNMGRLGTPVHALAFVDAILLAFGGAADIVTVRRGNRAIAAMLVLKFYDTWANPFVSSLIEFKNLYPNMLLYWEALNKAISAGARQFDFGRSQRDSGAYKFKQHWKGTEVPLDYHSYVGGIKVTFASTERYRGSKAAIFSKIWSRLPSSFQRMLGPKIRRYIP